MSIRCHAIEPRSRANGPGHRTVVWFQGCSLGCVGCFNPATHAREGGSGTDIEVHVLVGQIAARFAAGQIEGVTISGGEPFEQPEALLALVRGVSGRSGHDVPGTPLAPAPSVLVFSGHTIEEIRAMPLGAAVLAHVDVLIDGRFEAHQPLGAGLRGSANQRIHLLSSRYTRAQIEATPELEIRIDPSGAIAMTGVSPLRLRGRRP